MNIVKVIRKFKLKICFYYLFGFYYATIEGEAVLTLSLCAFFWLIKFDPKVARRFVTKLGLKSLSNISNRN